VAGLHPNPPGAVGGDRLLYCGDVTYYVLFFIRVESRRVNIAGITIHPGELSTAADRFPMWPALPSSEYYQSV
jgi:hypothetical protein